MDRTEKIKKLIVKYLLFAINIYTALIAFIAAIFTIASIFYPSFTESFKTNPSRLLHTILVFAIPLIIATLAAIWKWYVDNSKIKVIIEKGRSITVLSTSIVEFLSKNQKVSFGFSINDNFILNRPAEDTLHYQLVSKKLQKPIIPNIATLQKKINDKIAANPDSKVIIVPDTNRFILLFGNGHFKSPRIAAKAKKDSKIKIVRKIRIKGRKKSKEMIGQIWNVCNQEHNEIIDTLIVPSFGAGCSNDLTLEESVYAIIDTYFNTLFTDRPTNVNNLIIAVKKEFTKDNTDRHYIDLVSLKEYIEARAIIYNKAIIFDKAINHKN